ncbi:uncharacterized protein LOC105432052 [Pogonomyrmex barbatus]|uniref:Uncharacterized protein LOC105432052 n=1 Tax=Pogonomyrmex barbatus TaxID=144034 RepID=A0A8N1SB38_9HYME|nr:uncharacterized protein LOC105432052 [Pogonomyrmex barbatus]
MHEVLKRNLENQAISSQDLHESFVESVNWHDDFDNNENVRLSRGLKAINDTVISSSQETHGQNNKLDVADAINMNFEFPQASLQTFHDNSSILKDWHNNSIVDLLNIFNIYHNRSDQNAKNVQESILNLNTVNMNGNEDLEAAEQKYVNQTSRIRRAAILNNAFYDDVNQNQDDSDTKDENLDNQFHFSNILENQPEYHKYATRNWNDDIEDFDRHSKIFQTNKRKKKSGKRNKKNKHLEKHGKKSSSRSPSNRNRRHHTHRSDMTKNVNRGDSKLKQKNKAEASPLIGRTRIQKSKTAEQDLLRAGVNEASGEKVLYESVEDQSTVKPKEDDARRKEITMLLAADNIDDESQMDVALHGELAGKIVEQIFEQVQQNDQLKNVFGPGLHRDYKAEDVIAGNVYRQGLDEDGTNRTETMIKRVMELLGTLILNEAQKETCVLLSPEMREFLGWMLEVDREESLEEAPPLPLIREKIIPEQHSGHKFLFDSSSKQERKENINDLEKKVRVLETLVKKYNALTAKEKTKVQVVHDYLIRQLNLILQYIEARESTEAKDKLTSIPIGTARTKIGNILQYQSAVSNATNASDLIEKNAFSSSINTHNPFRSNNLFETADRQLHDSRIASRRRETRSLDENLSKQHYKTKRQKFHNQKRNKNYGNSRRRHKKHFKHLDRAGLSSGNGKSRKKRANPEENNQASLYYLGYEKPRIYDSLDVLDVKLTGKKKKRKRELADKENVATENDRMLDLLPIKGKNRVEDEVMLLNKREAWKRENKKQLEEVAFGKDMRNSTRRERERFEKLMEEDKRKPINETSSRMKREDMIRGTPANRNTDCLNKFHTASEICNSESRNHLKSNNANNSVKSKNELELVERKINVFPDNKTDAAVDSAVAEVSTQEKLATNAGTNNEVKGKLRAINRETKIDKAGGSTGFVNLTSDTKRVSKGRQKASAMEKEADDNTVKLNRTTNYRREEVDPEIELKNLRQGQEERIYDDANWKMTDYSYDNDNLSRNKLRKNYVTKLDKLGDLDTDPENNLELLRLRNNKWSNDVVEWKLLPIIKRLPRYDYPISSRIEEETPILSNIKDMKFQSNAYLNNPKLWRLGHRRRNVFNILPILTITNNDNFPRRIHRKIKSKIAKFKNLQVDPRIIFKVRQLSRLKNTKRSNSIAEFGMPFVLKDSNRKYYEILRPRNHSELGDRVIYDGIDLRLPVWQSYQYYNSFADSPIFHFVPSIREKGDDIYRYPTEIFFEYDPFKEHRTQDLNRQFAKRNRFRTKKEDSVEFPRDNLTNKNSKSKFMQIKFHMEMDKPTLANRKDHLVSSETKYTGKMKEINKTKTKLIK